MIKKTITYTDFNDEKRSEDFYFNLSRAEVIDLESVEAGGTTFSDRLKQIAESKDNKQIMETFKEILRLSYGVKSADGKRFIKNEAYFEEFLQSEAYSELLVEFLSDGTAAANFVNGLVKGFDQITAKSPSEIARERSEAQLQGHKKKDHEGSDIQDVPTLPTVTEKASEVPTTAPVLEAQPSNNTPDVNSMSVAELREALAAKAQA